jgi:hypothetical protein
MEYSNTGTLVYSLTDSIYKLVTLSASISDDPNYLARIWNPNNGSLLYTLTGHTRSISSLKSHYRKWK